MKTRNWIYYAVALFALPSLYSQTTDASQAINDAIRIRADLVTSIAEGKSSASTAVDQLKSVASPSGVSLDPDADFALAAIDIGQRLLVVQKPVEAEVFFRAADKSLTPTTTSGWICM